MKKILAMAIGAAVVASFASAQTYSKNAVGFINVPVEAGKLYALTVPFENMEAGSEGLWDFEETQLAKDAEFGSTVYIWDENEQVWMEFNKGPLGFGIDEEYALLEPGQCFFFEPAGDEPKPIVITGQVPAKQKATVRVMGNNNLSAIGNPFPTDVVFEETELAKGAESGSTVYIWDGDVWLEYNKGPLGFGIDEEYATIKAGQGFFFQTAEDEDSSEWEADKEYDWP